MADSPRLDSRRIHTGRVLNLDIDPKTHPAWTGGEQRLLDRAGRVSKFSAKFGSIGAAKR